MARDTTRFSDNPFADLRDLSPAEWQGLKRRGEVYRAVARGDDTLGVALGLWSEKDSDRQQSNEI